MNDPSGFAYVDTVSVRALVTSTRCPDNRADSAADTASGREVTSGCAGGVSAAAARGPVSARWVTTSTPDTTSAAASTAATPRTHLRLIQAVFTDVVRTDASDDVVYQRNNYA